MSIKYAHSGSRALSREKGGLRRWSKGENLLVESEDETPLKKLGVILKEKETKNGERAQRVRATVVRNRNLFSFSSWE